HPFSNEDRAMPPPSPSLTRHPRALRLRWRPVRHRSILSVCAANGSSAPVEYRRTGEPVDERTEVRHDQDDSDQGNDEDDPSEDPLRPRPGMVSYPRVHDDGDHGTSKVALAVWVDYRKHQPDHADQDYGGDQNRVHVWPLLSKS